MYKLFLCLRYLRKRRIAFFAVMAVALCVFMVLVVVSVMGGFLQMVKDRSRGMLGDLVVENGALQGFGYYGEFIDTIKKQMPDQIVEATPVIISYGVIRFPTDQITKPVQIVGIKLEETCRVNDFKNGLFYEKYYPGTTTLADQKVPAYGLDASDNHILLPEMEAAYRKWYSSATAEERAKAPIDKDASYKRPGYFRSITTEQAKKSYDPAWIGESLPGAILGTDLCSKRLRTGGYERYYYRGYEVQVTFVPLPVSGKMSSDTGMPTRLLRYADDSRTGVYDIDSMSVYIDFAACQNILRMNERPKSDEPGSPVIPARTTQVQIKLKPGVDPIAARERVSEAWQAVRAKHLEDAGVPAELLDRVTVLTWEEKQARFIAAVEKERTLVTALFGVVSSVAVFLVGCIFYMIVQQKTRDIGIIKSVGATSVGVANIFISYGAAVGIVGGAMGVLAGTVFVWHINDVQAMLERINPSLQVWSPEVYAFDYIPNQVALWDALCIYSVAIVASMLGSVIAAWRASRIWPVEALRYE